MSRDQGHGHLRSKIIRVGGHLGSRVTSPTKWPGSNGTRRRPNTAAESATHAPCSTAKKTCEPSFSATDSDSVPASSAMLANPVLSARSAESAAHCAARRRK
eukprot:2966521-Alexandrium_andersonii.AAC.1